MRVWLLDTGPLVAYLDAGEPEHSKVTACLGGFAGRLSTTSAVITEAMHFVSADPGGAGLLAAFVDASGMLVFDYTQPAQLPKAALLMERYADTPMDFADATLVLLADELVARDIVTLDRRGFATYRTFGGKAFRLVLDSA